MRGGTMITPIEAREIAKAVGVYTRKIAEVTQVRYSYLSEWLCGKRNLNANELARLETYFDKLKTIM